MSVVDFEDARGRTFRNLDLSGARFKETMLVGTRFSGLIDGLVVNDVEVAPLIVAELDRRHPERLRLRPTDAGGLRDAWSVVEELWARAKERAAAVPEEALHARPEEDEWSWAEHFRHLVFVTDAWVTGAALDRTDPPHPWGLPPSFLAGVPGIDTGAAPSWPEVVEVREGRLAMVGELVAGLTDDGLARRPREHTVLHCLRVVLDEEWAHHHYANRDLDQRLAR